MRAGCAQWRCGRGEPSPVLARMRGCTRVHRKCADNRGADLNRTCASILRTSRARPCPLGSAAQHQSVQHGAYRCNMVQVGATWCISVQHGASRCNMVQVGATWCLSVQHGAYRCNIRTPSCNSVCTCGTWQVAGGAQDGGFGCGARHQQRRRLHLESPPQLHLRRRHDSDEQPTARRARLSPFGMSCAASTWS
jgi:hypothetical protein